jgi:hypothetical protein
MRRRVHAALDNGQQLACKLLAVVDRRDRLTLK